MDHFLCRGNKTARLRLEHSQLPSPPLIPSQIPKLDLKQLQLSSELLYEAIHAKLQPVPCVFVEEEKSDMNSFKCPVEFARMSTTTFFPFFSTAK